MLSGFLILYIDIAKELPATLILRPFNFDTLAVRIYELASNEMLYKTGFPSLLLVITTASAVLLLNFKPKRKKKMKKIVEIKNLRKIFCKGNICVANSLNLDLIKAKFLQF